MRLKELREERELTQTDVAKAINTSRTNIGRWEKMENEPTSSFVVALANFFECSTDYLLGRTDDFGSVTIKKEKSPAVALSAEEEGLLNDYRKLPADLKNRASVYMKKLLEIIQQENTSAFSPIQSQNRKSN